jgi:hypothetical protein
MKRIGLTIALSAFVSLMTGCTTLDNFYGGIYDALRLRNQRASVEQCDPPGVDQRMTYQQYESELRQLDRKKAENLAVRSSGG